jgi:hypothetical protein
MMGVMLYHYTSLDALIKIVEGGVFWASNIHYLNDGREVAHAVQIVESEFLRLAHERVEHQYFVNIVRELLAGSSSPNVFVVSFSENGDLLSQWRAYCPPGRGVSIGIQEEDLRGAVAAQGLRFVQCVYDPDQQRAIAAEMVERLLSEYEQLEDGADTDHRADCGELASVFVDDVAYVAPAVKDPAFSEEREWRVVWRRRGSRRDIQHRQGTSFIVPFVEFPVPSVYDRLAISEVVVGPTAHAELSQEAIRSLLGSCRIPAHNVRLSRVPFRAW